MALHPGMEGNESADRPGTSEEAWAHPWLHLQHAALQLCPQNPSTSFDWAVSLGPCSAQHQCPRGPDGGKGSEVGA